MARAYVLSQTEKQETGVFYEVSGTVAKSGLWPVNKHIEIIQS